MHILLIEPDKIQAQLVTEAIQRNDYTVTHVVSAQAAVHSVDELLPDVIVLELQLPRHNGIEFLYELRSYHEWLRIPVIVYSHVPPREFDQMAAFSKELGVIQALYKPRTSLAALCDAIRKAAPEIT